MFEKVKPLAGDVGQDGLGLSSTDREMLVQKVNVIFHSAATLDFGDSLKTTVDINLLGKVVKQNAWSSGAIYVLCSVLLYYCSSRLNHF